MVFCNLPVQAYSRDPKNIFRKDNLKVSKISLEILNPWHFNICKIEETVYIIKIVFVSVNNDITLDFSMTNHS